MNDDDRAVYIMGALTLWCNARNQGTYMFHEVHDFFLVYKKIELVFCDNETCFLDKTVDPGTLDTIEKIESNFDAKKSEKYLEGGLFAIQLLKRQTELEGMSNDELRELVKGEYSTKLRMAIKNAFGDSNDPDSEEVISYEDKCIFWKQFGNLCRKWNHESFSCFPKEKNIKSWGELSRFPRSQLMMLIGESNKHFVDKLMSVAIALQFKEFSGAIQDINK